MSRTPHAFAALSMALPLIATAGAVPPDTASSAPLSPIRQFARVAGIDGQGWPLIEESATTLAWMTPDARVGLEVITHPGRPRSRMLDPVAAQDYWRTGLADSGGCLLGLRLHVPTEGRSGSSDTLHEVVAVRFPHERMASGSTRAVADGYLVQADFQTDEMLGMIRLFSAERSPTDRRDTTVREILMRRNAGAPVEPRPHDPYDARFDATACYLDSDAPQWDAAVPDHALTKLRAFMARLLRQSTLPGVATSAASLH